MTAPTEIRSQASSKGSPIADMPTVNRCGVTPRSKATRTPLSHGCSIVSRILSTMARRRPVTVLGIPGGVATPLGVGVGYGVVAAYTADGPAVPESVVLVVLGVVSLCSSIVQYSLNVSLGEFRHREG